MNKKELGELRRRFRADRSAISRVYGCFVNCNGEIVSDLDISLGMTSQETAEKYLGFLKKSLSGGLGKNLVDISFSTQQVMDSPEHRLLTTLRKSRLQDEQARQAFYQQVISSAPVEGNYLILLAHDAYDVPHHGEDGELDAEGSDQVFSYIVCAVCPIKDGKTELGYFPGENAFRCVSGQTVAQPELGFLFPAFDDRAANIYHALLYSRDTEELPQSFLDAIFHTQPPLSAGEQKENFRGALVESLGEECHMDVLQTLHQQLAERVEEHKQSKDPEPLAMTAGEIAGILEDCGVSQPHAEAFREICTQQFGPDATLQPDNLIDTKKVELKTTQATISLDPETCSMVQERIIDGRRYLLIPVGEGLELNGLPIRVKRPGQEPSANT